MNKKRLYSAAATLAFSLSFAVPAGAVTMVQAGDFQVSQNQPTPNSDAAAAAFDAANPPTFLETFEDGDADGFMFSAGNILSSPAGNGAFNFAFNTTPGGSFVLDLIGVSPTFTFAAPISSFGMYLTGVQDPSLTISFNDGVQQIVSLERYGGGVQFFGVSDFVNPITSFSFNNTNDIVGIDDFRYTTASVSSAVPEPSTWTMMLLGFLAIGLGMRKQRKVRLIVSYS